MTGRSAAASVAEEVVHRANGAAVAHAQAAPRLLRNGEEAFARILSRIGAARRSIHMRCFDWRDDETGRTVAGALLAAADRGVRVTVQKDRVGANYEYLEGNRQSLLHKDLDLVAHLQTWFLMAVYWSWGSYRQQPSDLAAALARHSNVTIRASDKRFDHAKVWIFDDETLLLGGMGIGDDFHRHNVDFMVELEGAAFVRRFEDVESRRAEFDPGRRVDFLTHARGRDDQRLLEERLALLASARERLTIEMAYLGDPRCTDAVVAAVRRGVRVTLLTARRANIIGDLNLGTCDRILQRTGAPEHLRIALHPRMVHGKAVVADGRVVQIGSSNFTHISHEAYGEVDLYCRDAGFAERVEAAIEREVERSELARTRIPYRRPWFWVEAAIVAGQARRSRKNGSATTR